jgi:hypothetical protein
MTSDTSTKKMSFISITPTFYLRQAIQLTRW